jgi:hypothetical protein
MIYRARTLTDIWLKIETGGGFFNHGTEYLGSTKTSSFLASPVNKLDYMTSEQVKLHDE